jgi:glutathione synthase/RimK-type ligase-like ATP-grasp enzyme
MTFLGLAPFLRQSIAGTDLKPLCQSMLLSAEKHPLQANLWLNLSIALQCLGQREFGLTLQNQALELQRIYHLSAAQQPARLRLLLLMVPGDLAANTPIECLLENSDIDLDFYYLTPESPFAQALPEHDALLVAIGESDENRAALNFLTQALHNWPKPVINAPQHIANTDRAVASALLQNVAGLQMPQTLRVTRNALQNQASLHFPQIVRPLGSQGGHGLAKITQPSELANYLERQADAEFYVAPFVDYSDADGLFRKMRIALIDGTPYACHMGVSANWMIHYVNAGMYNDAWKRAEELTFMTQFDAFAQRHRHALQAIASRTGLDYLCIDCAQTPTGELLVFEIDHVMVVHAMDDPAQFPYKLIHMQKVKDAFCKLLDQRIASI